MTREVDRKTEAEIAALEARLVEGMVWRIKSLADLLEPIACDHEAIARGDAPPRGPSASPVAARHPAVRRGRVFACARLAPPSGARHGRDERSKGRPAQGVRG
jgi:hypothetical protein